MSKQTKHLDSEVRGIDLHKKKIVTERGTYRWVLRDGKRYWSVPTHEALNSLVDAAERDGKRDESRHGIKLYSLDNKHYFISAIYKSTKHPGFATVVLTTKGGPATVRLGQVDMETWFRQLARMMCRMYGRRLAVSLVKREARKLKPKDIASGSQSFSLSVSQSSES